MKYILLFLIFIHGLIHVLGFVKAFEITSVNQLSIPISKPLGILWLISTLLFLVAGTLRLFNHSYWWLPLALAIILSQTLIIFSWQDAKFGSIANIILFIVAVIGFATFQYQAYYQKEVKEYLLQKKYFDNEMITTADIANLPEPVQRYLKYTGAIGKPKVNNFKITFKGQIRKDEQSEWMPFTSEQYNFMHTPTRLFFMKAKMMKLPVAGYHCFKNGDAYMDIRLFSLIKVQYQDGPEMDMAETVTFFNDMCCLAPPTLIDKRIQWIESKENSVKASFTNNNITITAWLYFNEEGALINFVSNDRYAADAGKKLPWETPLKNYKAQHGYKIAGYADAIYTYPEKKLCYGQFETVDVEYNLTE
ncbi:MAG: hypothetical protein JNL24_06890 [Bacteroidia bacterium]|nr:hypothetical protein [Bacteroidia bacterium]